MKKMFNSNDGLRFVFNINDLRRGKPVFCKSISFFPTMIEEKSSHILAAITAVETNKIVTKYSKSGSFWWESKPDMMDLCTQVLNQDGFDVTEQYIKDRMINYAINKSN